MLVLLAVTVLARRQGASPYSPAHFNAGPAPMDQMGDPACRALLASTNPTLALPPAQTYVRPTPTLFRGVPHLPIVGAMQAYQGQMEGRVRHACLARTKKRCAQECVTSVKLGNFRWRWAPSTGQHALHVLKTQARNKAAKAVSATQVSMG